MSLPRKLNANEGRVLGALVEKSLTTPDQYPLTVNALRNACNQKSSRDPVMSLSDRDVHHALADLGTLGLVRESSSSGRAVRWEHRFRERLSLSPSEQAVLCLLLLRGPQTPGELRSRAGRLFAFVDRADVERTLGRLTTREPALAALLPRAAGQKEQRFRHCLGAPPAPAATGARPAAPASQPVATAHAQDRVATARDADLAGRVARLESRVAALEERLRTKTDNDN